MEPQSEKSPGLALPQPSNEMAAHGRHPEHVSAHAESSIQPSALNFGVPAAPTANPGAVPLPAPQATDDSAVTSSPIVVTDENAEALDEEWVNKAKAIVDKTKADPYLETQEISKAKAEYLRIRYNKHIKVAEEQIK